MSNVQQTTIDNNTIIFDAQIFAAPDLKIFDGRYWQTNEHLLGTAVGRGTTYFFLHNNREFVLRHYRRGGMIGKVVSDRYFFTTLANTRPWQEFHLLTHLQHLALPAPQPVAARITRNGLCYSADIIISRIPHSQDIFTLLGNTALSQFTWQAIGHCIRQFHQHCIYHHDLNIHNIMLDERQKVWLIDFDKCYVRSGENWQAANLARLKRSLIKEQNRQPRFYFSHDDWQALLTGYAG